MTQNEKIEFLKESITYFYEKEGRSMVYIADVLGLNRKMLSRKINEWGLVKADVRHMTPSNQKFLNRNRETILDGLDGDKSITDIASTLQISRSSLVKTFIQSDKELLHHYNMSKERLEKKSKDRIQGIKDKSSYEYDFDDLEGEIWKPILGYDGYEVSNMGRVKHYSRRYHSFHLLQPAINRYCNRAYVAIVGNDKKSKNLNLARLVAFSFVSGHSDEKNTVDHIDGNTLNNCADNLEWVSQGENNKRAFKNGKDPNRAYQRHGNFKSIVLNERYEFKTIRALAKFIGVSEVQAGRYLSGETKCDYTFRFVY